MKTFFLKTKTGRGFNNTFTLEDIEMAFNPDDESFYNWDGESVTDWAQDAEEGDYWENIR